MVNIRAVQLCYLRDLICSMATGMPCLAWNAITTDISTRIIHPPVLNRKNGKSSVPQQHSHEPVSMGVSKYDFHDFIFQY